MSRASVVSLKFAQQIRPVPEGRNVYRTEIPKNSESLIYRRDRGPHADGRQQVWTLDSGRLLSMWQLQPGGSWPGLSGWTGWPNPPLRWQNAPPLVAMTACEQSGGRGAAIWGVTLDHKLICDYQETPGGEWSGWTPGNWLGAPPLSRLTATQRSNGAVQLWGLTLNGGWLTTTRQEVAGGDWTEWSAVVNVPPM
jgi:hypothetical protein